MRKVAALSLTLALMTGLGACTPMDQVLGTVFGRSMRDQRSFDPYENTLAPPENSVAFSAGNYAAGPGVVNLGQPEGADDVPPPFTQLDVLLQAPVVVDLVNPVEASAESLVRGEELFLRFCAVCHGPDGAGTNCYLDDPEIGWPCAYPLVAPNVVAYPDGYLYGMIRVGRGIMPAYGHQIGHYDRWNLINYIRQLQGSAASPTQPSDGATGEASPTPDGQ
jgi:mono/diheme cytochrome c family protein